MDPGQPFNRAMMQHAQTADVDMLVIGGGVIGLAIGDALARGGRDVLVVERNGALGQETTARSSEVIHAGIYYPKGSLKARLCVAGRDHLYKFAAENGVNIRRTGKLIVAASPAEAERLTAIAAAGAANGVDDLRLLTMTEAKALEPEVSCVAALLSPSTGIVDSHGLMVALEGHLTTHGGRVVLATSVTGVSREDEGLFRVTVRNADTTSTITAHAVVAAAGLGMAALAPRLPRTGSYVPPAMLMAKGHYFNLRGRAPFRHLIYPIPTDGGLGVHVTLDLQGQARFGPDVQWVDRPDYAFDDPQGQRRADFAASIRRYWPDLDPDNLIPGYTGIRPKISGPGKPPADFAIHGPASHGIPNLVALYGIESPGLTASLAIGAHVAAMLAQA